MLRSCLCRHLHAQVISAGSTLQLPFAFSTTDMSERGATLVVKGDYNGRRDDLRGGTHDAGLTFLAQC